MVVLRMLRFAGFPCCCSRAAHCWSQRLRVRSLTMAARALRAHRRPAIVATRRSIPATAWSTRPDRKPRRIASPTTRLPPRSIVALPQLGRMKGSATASPWLVPAWRTTAASAGRKAMRARTLAPQVGTPVRPIGAVMTLVRPTTVQRVERTETRPVPSTL
jgi:hypothetical protein